MIDKQNELFSAPVIYIWLSVKQFTYNQNKIL